MEENIKVKIIELYNLAEDLEIMIKEQEEKNRENTIKDVENLKRELKRDGLYSEKIEDFLESYMRYYNK